MGLRLRVASVRGPSHDQDRMPNQDAVLIRHGRQSWLAVVSDGMGSCKDAAIGSHAVCFAARQAVREESFEVVDRDLVLALYRHWLSRLAALHVKPNDAVATCLLAWGLPDGRFRLFQLGDGLILGEPEPADGLATRGNATFCNETTGLGLSRNFDDWRCSSGRLAQPGDGIVLMTDGISDDLNRTEGFVRTLVFSLRNRGARSAKAALSRELRDWPTPHHSDDKTIAVIYRN